MSVDSNCPQTSFGRQIVSSLRLALGKSYITVGNDNTIVREARNLNESFEVRYLQICCLHMCPLSANTLDWIELCPFLFIIYYLFIMTFATSGYWQTIKQNVKTGRWKATVLWLPLCWGRLVDMQAFRYRYQQMVHQRCGCGQVRRHLSHTHGNPFRCFSGLFLDLIMLEGFR